MANKLSITKQSEAEIEKREMVETNYTEELGAGLLASAYGSTNATG